MDSFLDFLKLDVLLSQPQAFAAMLFCLSFLQPQPRHMWKKAALFAILHSVYTDVLIFYIPVYLHFANSILAMSVLIFFLFRDRSLKQRLSLLLFFLLFAVSMDLVLTGLLVSVGGLDTHGDIMRDHTGTVMAYMYPLLALIIAASWWVRHRRSIGLRRFYSYIADTEKYSLWRITVLIVLQFVMLSSLRILENMPDAYNYPVSIAIIYAVILVSGLTLVLVIRLIVRSREQAVRMTQDVYVEDIQRMFASIRGQRHDFINHLQVIHSFVQMGKTDELKRYVTDLVQETREMSEIVNHASPALAAFVQAKTTVAVAQGIAFSFELPSANADEERPIRDIDLVKILGNLVDNAFDEVLKLPPGSRFVHASVRREEGRMLLEVSNRGSVLSREAKEKMFQAGYTTKTDGSHSGLGLAIVAERTKHYGGTLELLSDDRSGTVFRISIPVKEMKAV